MTTESALTGVPGRIRMRCTRPSSGNSDQHGVLRDQRAETMDLSHHGTAPDRIRPEGRHFHRRSRRLETGQSEAEAAGHGQGNYAGYRPADNLVPACILAGDIHFPGFRGQKGQYVCHFTVRSNIMTPSGKNR